MMKPLAHWLILPPWLVLAVGASGAVYYVDANNPQPVPPYTNWASAATSIQDAVDVAVAGDRVLVADGCYAVGGRSVFGAMTNRVVLDKALTVQSVHGPLATVIAGAPAPEGLFGAGSIRCAYVSSGAVLSGFTLTNGCTLSGDALREESGGGAWCEAGGALTNCIFTDNWAGEEGGGAYGGTLSDCALTNNHAFRGGGAAASTLWHCALSANSALAGGATVDGTLYGCTLDDNYAAGNGGGCYGGTLFDCVLSRNNAGDGSDLEAGVGGGASYGELFNCALSANGAWCGGGGADSCTLSNCTLTSNWSWVAGGAWDSTLYNCTLSGNYAYGAGGGTAEGRLHNCALTGNSAGDAAGGAQGGTFYNCTLTRNSATNSSGGTRSGAFYNSIVYFNTAPIDPDYFDSTFNYSCTTPLPLSGNGNISANPQLASATQLSAASPCIGAGSPAFSTGVDLDGAAWLNPPCMGADQYIPGRASGTLAVAVSGDYTNVATGFSVFFTSQIDGHATANSWDFGDGTVVSNQVCAWHLWTQPGLYAVRLTVYNDSLPAGVSVTTLVHVIERPIYYVNQASAAPVFPYTNWAAAARTIQEAIAAGTAAGRSVLVADGVYGGGGLVSADGTNQVALTDPVVVQSLNGPAVTWIVGSEAPGGSNGVGAIRCAYVANRSVLSGFTLTNGHSQFSGGGAWCELGGVVTNCLLASNSAGAWGGGAEQGTLYNCTLTGNVARQGGGADGCVLHNCFLNGNSASEYGGAAYGGALWNCAVNSNSASGGGGAAYATLYNCTVTGNAASHGGGAYETTLYNCTVTGNSASSGSLHDYHPGGGGVNRGRLYNCIVYFNTARFAPNYTEYTAVNHSCTTPWPADGPGNIDADPRLASATHLAAGSPCIGMGDPAYSGGVDIDGEPWLNPPCIGADQYLTGSVTGALAVAMTVSYTNVAPGFAVRFTAQIEGRTTASAWDFGDGTTLSNCPFASHAWAQPGAYPVRLTAWNESSPAGVTTSSTVEVVGTMYYVNQASPTPAFPYTNWQTAATVIQDAVDAAEAAGATVMVSNGVYTAGGRAAFGTLTNRVCIVKALTLRSVSGPQATQILGGESPDGGNGEGAVRCVYLGDQAVLSGFTLANGHTRTNGDWLKEQSGGGVWCEEDGVVTNCLIKGNSAALNGGGACSGTLLNCALDSNAAVQQGGGVFGDSSRATPALLSHCTITGNSAWNGAGAYDGILRNCVISGNTAIGAEYWQGIAGGAYSATLVNCTVTGNSAGHRVGGVYMGALTNCIVYYNTAPDSPNWAGYISTIPLYDPPFNDSCTTPLPANGAGNIDYEPGFVDRLGGNLRLRSDSPCINAGNNAAVSEDTDFGGLPRIAGGTVDIGAYEFQSPRSLISYAWLRQYGLAMDGSADFADSDSDGMNNWQEWRCGTCPTNALSALRLVSAAPAGTDVTLTWQSVAGANYFLGRSTNLASPFMLLATNVIGQAGTTTYTDTNAATLAPLFYRVGVKSP